MLFSFVFLLFVIGDNHRIFIVICMTVLFTIVINYHCYCTSIIISLIFIPSMYFIETLIISNALYFNATLSISLTLCTITNDDHYWIGLFIIGIRNVSLFYQSSEAALLLIILAITIIIKQLITIVSKVFAVLHVMAGNKIVE